MASLHYDLSKLEDLAGGDRKFIDSMVEVFLEHTPRQLEELNQSRKSGDLVKLGILSHKLKANIDLFGIEKLKTTIRNLEAMGRKGTENSEIDISLDELNTVLTKVITELQDR